MILALPKLIKLYLLLQKEMILALPKLIKLNPIVVKEVFNRLLGTQHSKTINSIDRRGILFHQSYRLCVHSSFDAQIIDDLALILSNRSLGFT